MALLYANENFPLPVVEFLRRLGHDVVTVAETGRAEQAWPDVEVLHYATQARRILLTLNRKHFLRLHRLNEAHAGIIVCTFDADFAALAQRVHDAIDSVAAWDGALVRVNRPSASP